MERLHRLLHLQQYKQAQKRIEEYEENRMYCRHGKEHCRDVARIAYIISLEEQLEIEKEMIYTTAYLHDIGRVYEYQKTCSHESGSIAMAMSFLPECGFTEMEIQEIVDAICTHRDKKNVPERNLSSVINRADKLSRDCFNCLAKDSCKWSEEKKNKQIVY